MALDPSNSSNLEQLSLKGLRTLLVFVFSISLHISLCVDFVATVQGCASDKDVSLQSRSGTLDDTDGHKLRGEEDAVQSRHRVERARTPATVAEPDSTMSNEVGDQMTQADVEPIESDAAVDCAADERSDGRRVLDDNDVMSSNCDATAETGCRNVMDRFSLERLLGFDALRSGNRSDVAVKLDTKQAEGASNIEPSSSRICQKKSKLETERLNDMTSRKRQCTDVEQSGIVHQPSSAETMDNEPTDGVRKKHRPDPLVLPASSVEHYGYPSWLRSPRVWNGNGTIPYTPPPMLSPARRAPGLFWAAARGQNQPLWSLFRQPSAFTCEFVLW